MKKHINPQFTKAKYSANDHKSTPDNVKQLPDKLLFRQSYLKTQ